RRWSARREPAARTGARQKQSSVTTPSAVVVERVRWREPVITLLVVGSLAMSLTPSPACSRRRLLQAAALSPLLSACTSGSSPEPAVDPDRALRDAAIARERAL